MNKRELRHLYWLLKNEKVDEINKLYKNRVIDLSDMEIDVDLRNKNLAGLKVSFNFRDSDFRGSAFSGSNFKWSNFKWSNFDGSNFSGSNFKWSNFKWSDFRDSNFRDSNFRDSNFSGSDFSGSYFRGSDFRDSDFSDSNFSDSNFSGSNFSGSDFRGSDFRDSNFSDSNFSGSDFRGCTLPATLQYQCPEEGSFVAWKKCKNDVIVKLLIPEHAKRSSATTRKCRASEAVVLDIFGAKEAVSNYDKSIVYRKGETVKPDSFNEDRWNECSNGIHFFITRKEAEEY